MVNLKFILIVSCLFFSGINAMRYDLEHAYERHDQQSNQEIKRDLEEVSGKTSLSLTLPSEDSDQELMSQIKLCSPFSDKDSLKRLVSLYKISRKKDIATGAALAHKNHADKVFEHQGKIISHEDRIANLEKLIHDFEETLNKTVGGFNEGKQLLFQQLNELKAELKIVGELLENHAVQVAILDTNQNNERLRIDRSEKAYGDRLRVLETNLNHIQGFIEMLRNPIETAKAVDQYYTKKSELIFLASLAGWITNNAVIKAAGAAPILGMPLKHFVSALSLPLRLTLAANLGLSSYKLAQKHSYIKDYKKSIVAGTSSVATIAAGFFTYKKYLQVAKFISEMPISL